MNLNLLDFWKAKSLNSFAVKQISDTHRRIECVTARGRVYAQTWAAERADPLIKREEVEDLWRNDRKRFLPFDQVAGCFV